jgi:hypothetical protein
MVFKTGGELSKNKKLWLVTQQIEATNYIKYLGIGKNCKMRGNGYQLLGI